MPRTRNVKPGFFSNELMGLLPHATQLSLIGMYQLADREGRQEAQLRRIKAHVFPYRDDIRAEDIETSLCELEAAGFIVRYTVDDKKYIYINNFKKHQYISKREASSTLPPPPRSGSMVPVSAEAEASPIPVSALSQPCLSLGQGTNDKGQRTTLPHRTMRRTSDPGFDGFWASYPRKVDKRDAERAWASLPTALQKAALRGVVALADEWSARPKAEIRFCPHAATWIHGRRWEDEAPSPGPAPAPAPLPPFTPEEAAMISDVGMGLREKSSLPEELVEKLKARKML